MIVAAHVLVTALGAAKCFLTSANKGELNALLVKNLSYIRGYTRCQVYLQRPIPHFQIGYFIALPFEKKSTRNAVKYLKLRDPKNSDIGTKQNQLEFSPSIIASKYLTTMEFITFLQ